MLVTFLRIVQCLRSDLSLFLSLHRKHANTHHSTSRKLIFQMFGNMINLSIHYQIWNFKKKIYVKKLRVPCGILNVCRIVCLQMYLVIPLINWWTNIYFDCQLCNNNLFFICIRAYMSISDDGFIDFFFHCFGLLGKCWEKIGGEANQFGLHKAKIWRIIFITKT